MKREVARFDFKAFGQAIKAARKAKGISRNQLADKMNIAPRYIASIENSGQHPSLQIFYELVTLLDVSVSSGTSIVFCGVKVSRSGVRKMCADKCGLCGNPRKSMV